MKRLLARSGYRFLSVGFLSTLPWILVGAPGCEGPGICAIERRYGVQATVRGGANVETGAPGGAGGDTGTTAGASSSAGEGGTSGDGECAARVTATSEDYSEELDCSARGADCICRGLTELPGTYEIVARLGTRRESQTTTVRPTGCGVVTRELVFFE